jgi:hypothetical protein
MAARRKTGQLAKQNSRPVGGWLITKTPGATRPPEIGTALAEKRRSPEAVLCRFGEGDDFIVGLGNGEPVTVVTTFKNVVDCFVTEYGVAELRESSIRERTRKLIDISHPKFRDDLELQARKMGYL